MKIFNTENIRAWDAYTIEKESIESVDLMNRAAAKFSDWFASVYTQANQPVLMVCGTGNNGGDGVAVARMLNERFFEVSLLVCDFSDHHSPDFDWQMQHLPPFHAVSVVVLKDVASLPSVPENAIVVDAIFGSGLSRTPQGAFAQVIEWINNLPNEVVSIDLPSGLFADEHTSGIAVQADRTFSFEIPKMAFFFPENAGFLGDWCFQSIGLDRDFQKKNHADFQFLTLAEARKRVQHRQKFDHKGRFGHALLIAGSRGKIGAAVLSARACLRAGTGLLTVQTPLCGLDILQASVPEAMCSPDDALGMWSVCPEIQRYSALGVGCGIGMAEQTAQALKTLLCQSPHPLVLDADALNLLSENPEWWHILPKNTLLTPHPKEFERLFGKTDHDFDRNRLQRKMAQERGIFILLKGAYSAMACPDGECWFNSTGNPGMATGGSGDVLTGILTGLLAQGYDPKSALLLGVFLHGLAGDLAAEARSQEALVAGDLVDFLGAAWQRLGA